MQRTAPHAAVVLFAARARAGDRGFELGDGNAPAVAEICRQLDGIRLAIELAAARVHVLTLRALSSGLEWRLALLGSGDRTALPRPKTMRALISSSGFRSLPAGSTLPLLIADSAENARSSGIQFPSSQGGLQPQL